MIEIIRNSHPSHHHHRPPSAALILNQFPRIRSWVCDSLASNISMKCFQEESRREWGKQEKNRERAEYRCDSKPLPHPDCKGHSRAHIVSHWGKELALLTPMRSVICCLSPQGRRETPRHVWLLCWDLSSTSGPRTSCEEGHWYQPGSKVKGDWVVGSKNQYRIWGSAGSAYNNPREVSTGSFCCCCFCHSPQLAESYFLDQGSNTHPLHWKHRVLTTGLPWKCPIPAAF